MIQGEAAPGVPIMTREGAILEVLVVVHIAKAPFTAPFTATAIAAGAEGPSVFFENSMKEDYD